MVQTPNSLSCSPCRSHSLLHLWFPLRPPDLLEQRVVKNGRAGKNNEGRGSLLYYVSRGIK